MPAIYHQDLSGTQEALASDFKLDSPSPLSLGLEIEVGGDYPPLVEVRPYFVNWDGRRRGRFVKWYAVYVGGKCVKRGLKQREAEKRAEALRKVAR